MRVSTSYPKVSYQMSLPYTCMFLFSQKEVSWATFMEQAREGWISLTRLYDIERYQGEEHLSNIMHWVKSREYIEDQPSRELATVRRQARLGRAIGDENYRGIDLAWVAADADMPPMICMPVIDAGWLGLSVLVRGARIPTD